MQYMVEYYGTLDTERQEKLRKQSKLKLRNYNYVYSTKCFINCGYEWITVWSSCERNGCIHCQSG